MRDALIEAMARAICVSYGDHPDEVVGFNLHHQWNAYSPDAVCALDAALSFLENPSDDMVEAGQFAVSQEPGSGDAQDGWKAMLNTLKAPA